VAALAFSPLDPPPQTCSKAFNLKLDGGVLPGHGEDIYET